jgi:hypothetical protein
MDPNRPYPVGSTREAMVAWDEAWRQRRRVEELKAGLLLAMLETSTYEQLCARIAELWRSDHE